MSLLFRPSENVHYTDVYIVYISIISIACLLRFSFLRCELTDSYSIYNTVYGVARVTVYNVYISRLFGIRILPQTVPAHHLLQTVSTQPQLARGAGNIAAALIKRFHDHPPLEGRDTGLEITPLT